MTVLRLPVVLLLSGLLGLVGCTAHKPVPLYQLDAGSPGVPKQAQGLAVLLGPVLIADYLQREAFLQRQTDGSLVPADDARWAGSLAADIDQVLLRQLAARLDSQRLVLAPAHSGFTPDVQVLLNVSRLDSGPDHPAVLEAQWRLLDRSGQLRDSRLVRLQEPHDGSAADQVQAQSRLLRQLVQLLGDAIEPLRNQPIAEASKPTPPPVRPSKPKNQEIPRLSPPRNGGEVLRF
ncbi:PqiC family protein [Aquipseudomonas ullengensis]|uniref:Membrane integrity-associated transporter subunit PqiC n=1 Tax=Aquipseudomonas ullengensis TaxID=2759166 RepID=A0A7W4LLF2_9GAMM|nr:PqiC family protein [Pseudomonas ullengensis]MBB2495319.1 membrane integrity-associated transporter subunit PqiC [Pseudomonas ullengensis]